MSARRGRTSVAALALLVAAAGSVLAAARAAARARRVDERVFPHLAHAPLFSSCAGCHAAIVDSTDPANSARGAAAAYRAERFPPYELCVACHTERERPIPAWRAPSRRATTLRFSHEGHAQVVAGSAAPAGDGARRLDCAACHAVPGDTRRMAVGRARPETCLGCHAPGTAHLADSSRCTTCHVALTAATGLSAARVAALPRPPSHEGPDFVARHGALATAEGTRGQCATCHATESCTRCHMNGAALPSVTWLGRDARVAALVAGRAASYPSPGSHAEPAWAVAHGAAARRAPAGCASCHAQRSCAACHVNAAGRAASAIARLPTPPPEAGAQGVRLVRASAVLDRDGLVRADADGPSAAGTARVPPPVPPRDPIPRDTTPRDTTPSGGGHAVRVHAAGFAREHAAAARTRSPNCAGCHAQRFCASCHAGEGRRRFHPPDFALRHAPAAYGRERDCQSCHSAEAFCRACHVGNGVASRGRRDVAYHDAQPQWLLQHGRAARQGLESCITCHQQRDCMQCHSSSGLRINPHGPGFDAERMRSRSVAVCITCHGRDPLAGK